MLRVAREQAVMVGVGGGVWWGRSSREGLRAAAQRVMTVREGGGEIKSEGSKKNGGRETKRGTRVRKEARLNCQSKSVDEEEEASVTQQNMQELTII